MATIITRVESARGCGYRKKGGIYLVSDGLGTECLRLPIPLEVCPCCGEGIRQTRGFRWISSDLISEPCEGFSCSTCPLGSLEKKQKFGLLWVGEKFYKSSAEFTTEALARGVSKRIAQVPRDLELGKTWILLGHPRACSWFEEHEGKQVSKFAPGIFHAFRPSRIEYIVKGTETTEELDHLEERGFTLIQVVEDHRTQTTLL